MGTCGKGADGGADVAGQVVPRKQRRTVGVVHLRPKARVVGMGLQQACSALGPLQRGARGAHLVRQHALLQRHEGPHLVACKGTAPAIAQQPLAPGISPPISQPCGPRLLSRPLPQTPDLWG